MSGLVLERVSHRYGLAPVLLGIDLALGPGEIAAVLGPSGCGKTTLLRITAGLLAPAAGRVERPAAVGMAFQEPRLLPWRDCLGNVLFGCARPTDSVKDRARMLLGELGLGGYEEYYPGALSGGMAHRVSLARALVARPELLLLDEPLNGMDYFGRIDLEERLAKICQVERPAVLLVTHDPDEAVYLADRVLVLSARPGKVVAEIKLTEPRPRERCGAEAARARAEVTAALMQIREERRGD
ncbi:MAG: ABC transporter ATP-binding protein [Bacteroidota bacterium]